MRVHEFTLDSVEWGQVKIMRPIPIGKDGDRWGDFAPLKGTYFEDLIPLVSGEAMSHALHGYIVPLMKEIGPVPDALMRMIPKEHRYCAEEKCALRSSNCYPNPKMIECYIPPNLSFEAQMVAQMIVLAWRENRFVVVVTEGEFSIG